VVLFVAVCVGGVFFGCPIAEAGEAKLGGAKGFFGVPLVDLVEIVEEEGVAFVVFGGGGVGFGVGGHPGFEEGG